MNNRLSAIIYVCPDCFHAISEHTFFSMRIASMCRSCGCKSHAEFIRTTTLRAGIALNKAGQVGDMIDRARDK